MPCQPTTAARVRCSMQQWQLRACPTCTGLVPKQYDPSNAPAQQAQQEGQGSTCIVAAEDAVTEQLLEHYDAAICYAALWHCPLSQQAASLVHASPCRWRLVLETLEPSTQPAGQAPEAAGSKHTPLGAPAQLQLPPAAPQKARPPQQLAPQPDAGAERAGRQIRLQQPHQPAQQQQQQHSLLDETEYDEQHTQFQHDPGAEAVPGESPSCTNFIPGLGLAHGHMACRCI